MTREEFFNALNGGAKWDVGVSIARTNPLPLDANSVFESDEALSNYVKTNALAYPGQLVVVLGLNNTVKVAVIESVGAEGKIKELAVSSGSSADIDTVVNEINTKIDRVVNGETPVAKATGDAQGRNIVETYVTKTELTAKEEVLEAEDLRLGKEISRVESLIAPAVQTEKERATAKEDKLQAAIDAEVKRLTEQDKAHDGKISAAEGRLTKLEDQIKGVTGAMHFAGVVEGKVLPPVDSYKVGDVIVLNGTTKEYVLVEKGTEVKIKEWIELGDEGVHATKNEVEALSQKITDEVKKLTEEDGKLATQITDEVRREKTRAEDAEGALGGRIDGVENKIGTKNDLSSVDSIYGAIEKVKEDFAAADGEIRKEFAAADKLINNELKDLKPRVTAVETKALNNETSIKRIEETIIPTLQTKADAESQHDAINTRVSNLEKKDTTHDESLKGVGDRLSAIESHLGKPTDPASATGTVEARLKQVIADVKEAGKIDNVAINGQDLSIVAKRVNIPVASADKLGVVKSAAADNKITIAEDGTMEVHKLNVNKLVQTGNTILILDGGNASGHNAA